MKLRISFVALFLFSYTNMAELQAQDIIRTPVISQRCKSMLEDRREKISNQNRLSGLLQRNERLQNQLKPNQQVVRRKLILNATRIENNLRLAKMKLKSMEEQILRKGCPGITL